MAAGRTQKVRLILTIGLVDMSAGKTSLGGVGRIDKFDGNASEGGFVTDESAKLEERPGRARGSLTFPNP